MENINIKNAPHERMHLEGKQLSLLVTWNTLILPLVETGAYNHNNSVNSIVQQ